MPSFVDDNGGEKRKPFDAPTGSGRKRTGACGGRRVVTRRQSGRDFFVFRRQEIRRKLRSQSSRCSAWPRRTASRTGARRRINERLKDNARQAVKENVVR